MCNLITADLMHILVGEKTPMSVNLGYPRKFYINWMYKSISQWSVIYGESWYNRGIYIEGG